MTLILAMSKPEGIYMSVDYRITDMRSRRLVSDAAVKFLTIQYPPDEGGPRALLAFTGLATLPDGTQTGDWIRETLRGGSEGFNRAMEHLRDRLDRDLAPLRERLIVNVLALDGSHRYFGGFTNVISGSAAPASTFAFVLEQKDDPFTFGNGSGIATALAGGHFDQIKAQLLVSPRRPFDHMKLLATINRRVAAKEPTVSPFCQVIYLNADDRTKPDAQAFLAKDETVPFAMPYLLFGIDLDVLARNALARFKAMEDTQTELEAQSTEDLNSKLRRRS